jgi:hypothetical protein
MLCDATLLFISKDMLRDYSEVTTPDPSLLELEASQNHKQDTYIQLAADGLGGYPCFDCAQDFCTEKMQDCKEVDGKQISNHLSATTIESSPLSTRLRPQ